LSIICVDFALSMRRSAKRVGLHFDNGHVDKPTLDALIAATASAQDEGQAVVWGIHYPPNFPGEKFKKLRGYRTLLEQAASQGVNHIFSGHTHEQLTYRTGKSGKDVVVHCAGSAMCYQAPCHGFYSHTIVTLNGKVDDVQSEEFTFKQAKPPVANIAWQRRQILPSSHQRIRLPWLQRFRW
jgi:3',5'-cyclic AMP phosphodiesterase CpdA